MLYVGRIFEGRRYPGKLLMSVEQISRMKAQLIANIQAHVYIRQNGKVQSLQN